MRVLGLDPGHTTGYAVIEINEKLPSLKSIGESKDPTMLEIREFFENCDIIVYEDFLLNPKKAMRGDFNNSRLLTIQVIGAIVSLAAQHQKQTVKQMNSVKPVGYGWAKLKYSAGKKGMHQQDALAHAMYYCVSKKLCQPIA